MKTLIHIQFDSVINILQYENIIDDLTKYFNKVDDDTFEIKDGLFLKIKRDELIIYADDEK